MRSSLVVVLVLAAACGGDASPVDAPGQAGDGGDGDAAPSDGRLVDAPDPIDAPVDAPIDAPTDAAMGGCGGALIGGFCWYKGNQAQSCNAACATHGGANAATVSYAGAVTAGSRANQARCQQIAAALSTLAFSAATTSVGAANDYGCVEEPGNNRTELVSTNVTTNVGSNPLLRRFCACNL